MICIEINTTGLYPNKDQIVDFAASTYVKGKLETYHYYIKHHRYYGTAYGMYINQKVFESLSKNTNYIWYSELAEDFVNWLFKIEPNQYKTTPVEINNLLTSDPIYTISFLNELANWSDLVKLTRTPKILDTSLKFKQNSEDFYLFKSESEDSLLHNLKVSAKDRSVQILKHYGQTN